MLSVCECSVQNGLEDDAKDAMPAYSVNSGGILNLGMTIKSLDLIFLFIFLHQRGKEMVTVCEWLCSETAPQ